MPDIHNRKFLTSFRKSLRNNSTSAEASLWKILKKRQIGGLKFRRQHSVGRFILDFYCPEIKLSIELDGEPHVKQSVIEKDLEKENYLANLSIRVIRYENRWVYEYPEDIINDILRYKEGKV